MTPNLGLSDVFIMISKDTVYPHDITDDVNLPCIKVVFSEFVHCNGQQITITINNK